MPGPVGCDTCSIAGLLFDDRLFAVAYLTKEQITSIDFSYPKILRYKLSIGDNQLALVNQKANSAALLQDLIGMFETSRSIGQKRKVFLLKRASQYFSDSRHIG